MKQLNLGGKGLTDHFNNIVKDETTQRKRDLASRGSAWWEGLPGKVMLMQTRPGAFLAPGDTGGSLTGRHRAHHTGKQAPDFSAKSWRAECFFWSAFFSTAFRPEERSCHRGIFGAGIDSSPFNVLKETWLQYPQICAENQRRGQQKVASRREQRESFKSALRHSYIHEGFQDRDKHAFSYAHERFSL